MSDGTYKPTTGELLYKTDASEPVEINYTVSATAPTFTLAKFPNPVGYWCLYGGGPQTKFAMYQKPTDEQIKNTEALLGWKLEDAK